MVQKRITIHVAKTQLSRLIERACKGEEIVISRRDVPVVRLVPMQGNASRRKFGAMKGRAKVTEAFFAALPPEELAGWEA